MAYVVKYGARWPDTMDPLEIEFDCIRRNGHWKHPKTGDECGDGLFNHFMTARKLIWPHRYRHRWTELMYENFIANDLTVLLGSASSQKTSHAVEFSLLNYWARPDNTLIILSTVNMEKLEIGVWGECKKLWSEGRTRYDWLAGNIIDHKKAIATDSIGEDEVRDMRKGVQSKPVYVGGRWVGLGVLAGLKQDFIVYVADECFPADTLVDTPHGEIAIQFIQPGDTVISAAGLGIVSAVSQRYTHELICIRMRDGRFITCTPNHPFFTQYGWEKACNLNEDHYIMAPYETMQIMWHSIPPNIGASVKLRYVPKTHSDMQMVQESISALSTIGNTGILQSILLREMETEATRDSGKDVQQGTQCQDVCIQNGMVENSGRTKSQDVCGYEGQSANAQSRYLREGCGWNSGSRLQTARAWREWHRTIKSRMATDANVSRGQMELPNLHGHETRFGVSPALQSRFSLSRNQTRNRSGRSESQQSVQTSQRPEENSISGRGAWVESVEVLKQDDPRFPHTGSDSRGCAVYNLQVEGHPSYSVNGLVAHNCQFMQEAFSLTWPHLFSNGNVKIIVSGNPRHDPGDELGKTAEPKCGWAAFPEPEKTSVWETKFMGGKCINLVGTDSPNFDVPEDAPEPYPRLIGRKFANRIAHDHGPASFEFYRLVKGVMKVSFAHSRVITRQLCREHHASEQVKWRDDVQTNIYSLDPSYGGEDRCVGMPAHIGIDVDGNQILEFLPYRVFRFDLRKEIEVEDQIAEILKEELDLYDVPPENCFYDATGKGTIGAALARKFGHRVPVAIDSGARPTKRPVREDLFIEEIVSGSPQKRLKRCDEHYSKFVSEMWFSLRYAIEAGQVRGLQEDVIEEGCARIYEMVSGNKLEVEPKSDPKKKEDLKRRLGKSPDLFDAAVLICEGARQRGFKIKRLGSTAQDDGSNGFEWLKERVRKHDSLMRSKQLEYA